MPDLPDDITRLRKASYALEDLQSTNGTKVNGKRIRSAELTHGDCVEVGHTKFEFLLNDPGE